MSTISSDRVVQGEVVDYILCKICSNILLDPMECTQCETSFCNKCISNWILRKQNEVPGQEPSCPKQCKFLQIKKSHALLRSHLNSLIVKCGISDKCGVRDSIQKILEHEPNCNFNIVECPNYNFCKSLIRKNEIDEHMEGCRVLTSSQEKCNQCLNLKIQGFKHAKQHDPLLKMHQDYFCPKLSLINCIYCNTNILKSKFYEHIKYDCCSLKELNVNLQNKKLLEVNNNSNCHSENNFSNNLRYNELKYFKNQAGYKDCSNSDENVSDKSSKFKEYLKKDEPLDNYYPRFLSMVSYDDFESFPQNCLKDLKSNENNIVSPKNQLENCKNAESQDNIQNSVPSIPSFLSFENSEFYFQDPSYFSLLNNSYDASYTNYLNQIIDTKPINQQAEILNKQNDDIDLTPVPFNNFSN